MIFDAHTHIGFGGLIAADPKKLLASMKNAGIDKAAVFAGAINNCSTEQLLNAIKNYRDTLCPIGSISPLSRSKPPLKIVEEWLRKDRIYGLKFYPGYEHFYPADAALKPYLALLVRYNRPAIFHAGDLYNRATGARLQYAHPLRIDELAVRMPNLKIIIAHMGYPWIIDAAEVVHKNMNVFSDCSGFVYGKFDKNDKEELREIFYKLFYRFDIGDKLLFGTDWPISEQSSYVRVVSQLSGRFKNNILSKNALKAFGLHA